MQMASNDDLGIEPRMPVLSLLRAAPEAEARYSWNENGVFAERPVVDNHEWQARLLSCGELVLCLLDKSGTPFIS